MSDMGKKWMESATELVEPSPYRADESAVEVAAMLEDSLVDVKHVSHNRDPHHARRMWAWFGIGGALLAMAAISFAIAVSNAADNKTALHAWLDAGKPMHDFRPHLISLAFDWMAIGGAALGVLAIGFGLVQRRKAIPEPYFRTVDEFPLVAPAGDGFVCNIQRGMDGEVFDRGCMMTMTEAVEQGVARPSASVPEAIEIPIPQDGRVRVRSGKVTYVLATVPAPKPHNLNVLARIESRSLAHFAGSALAHGLLLALIYNLPPEPKTLALDGISGNDRIRVASIEAFEQKLAPETDDADEASDDPSEGNAGGAETGAEGKMGIQESKNADGRYLVKRRRDKVEFSKGETIARAQDVGILRVFGAQGGARDPFATLTGTTLEYSSGISDRDVYGGLNGNEYRDAYGGWGSGVKDTGPGGGGDKWGTIGTGNYDTIGDGGPGNGPLMLHGKPPGPRLRRDPNRPETMKLGEVTSGGYDKALIRRYIKKKRERLRYCYEKQLLVDRSIEGTITSVFVINDQGSVISSNASGMGNTAVETCVAETVKSIVFPKPAEGGMHKVTYPFHFHPAGGN
jgi:hypothetical protein